MSEPLTLTIPVPPSLNNAYATVGGRRVLSREGRRFKHAVGQLVAFEQRRRVRHGLGKWAYAKGDRLSLSFTLHFPTSRRRDLSNVPKLPEDSLAAALAFDDSAVDVLHVERRENDKSNPRCEVRLEVL